MTSYISEQLLTMNVDIEAQNLHKDISNEIYNRLKFKIEGVCSEEGYTLKDSIVIIKKDLGKVVAYESKSFVRYTVTYKAKVLSPKSGDVMEMYVGSINKMGLLCYIKIKESDKPTDSPIIAIVPLDYIENSDYNINDINVGQTLKIRVLGSEARYLSTTIKAVGELV